MNRKKKKITLLIPAYNEQGGIEKTVWDIKKHAPDFDYVVINDCSSDRTLEVCRNNGFHTINLPVNLRMKQTASFLPENIYV